MRWTIALTSAVLALFLWVGVAFGAGPQPGGNSPWVLCPNNSVVCAAQLGPDMNPGNDIFDCVPNNGRPGRALQHSGTGAVKCWAL